MIFEEKDIDKMFDEFLETKLTSKEMKEFSKIRTNDKPIYLMKMAFRAGFNKSRQVSILR